MIYPVLTVPFLQLQIRSSQLPYTDHPILAVKFRKEEFNLDKLLYSAKNLQQNHLPQSHSNNPALLLLFKNGDKGLVFKL